MLSDAVRIKFAKTGKLKYISHLDLQRTMKTAFTRSKIPIWYTEGFNPRPKLVFALTVSVGSESICEYLDVKITEPMEKDEFISRLQGALTGELRILDVYSPETKFTEIAFSGYEIILDRELDDDFISRVLSKPMFVERHSKKGTKTDDIRDKVISVRCEGSRLFVILRASPDDYLNPNYFIDAINSALEQKIEDYSVVRTDCYRADMTEFS